MGSRCICCIALTFQCARAPTSTHTHMQHILAQKTCAHIRACTYACLHICMHASMHVCSHTLTQNMHPCIRVVVHPPARTSACTCFKPYLLTAYLPNYLAHRSKLAVDQTALCAQSSFLICRESNMIWRTVRFAVQVAVQIYLFNQIHIFRYSRFRCHGTCRAIQPNPFFFVFFTKAS